MTEKTLKFDAEAGQLSVDISEKGDVCLQIESNDIERPDFIRLTPAEWERIEKFVASFGSYELDPIQPGCQHDFRKKDTTVTVSSSPWDTVGVSWTVACSVCKTTFHWTEE